MTDTRAAGDDRLPWLEAVDEEEGEQGPGTAKLIAFVVIGLVAIGLIVGGLFWMSNRGGAGAEAVPEGGELIAAPVGDYKVKPEQPGGMDVAAHGDTSALAASQGAEPKGKIDMAAVPEAPIAARPQQGAAARLKAGPTPTEVAIAQPKTGSAPTPATAGGSTIQLGAFDSNAQAMAAWKALSGRFSYLAPLSQSVQSAQVNGRTFYRLRASGPDARGICNRLKVAGETCLVV